MRWANLTESTPPPATGTLPLIERAALARTFDTPDFRGITFYEIQAKSIINRVPDASHVPFRWTINPYRGCSHACLYCLAGETPVLMADGRTKPLAEVRVGDAVYGTRVVGDRRRYAVTGVLAQWRTTKPGYRVTLADGTVLIASGDHRFLTRRGWACVSGREVGQGTGQKPAQKQHPHLMAGDALCGTGGFAAPPKRGSDYQHGYQQGYLCGMGRDHLTFPSVVTEQWHKGFLAGAFDVSCSFGGDGLPCFSSVDPVVTDRLTGCLRALGFTFTIETGQRVKPIRYVRLLGGLRECLRFLHTVDPVFARKPDIEGRSVPDDPALGVVSVERLGVEMPLYDITTGTGDFIADGVVAHNCFARKTHTYLDLDVGRDFDSKIVVKVNAPELLRRELASARWRGEHIAMGTNVDCYQRAEGRYALMRGILEALRDFENPFSILTKGSLILRDLDLLQQAAEVTEVGVSVSVGFIEREMWRSLEPGTPSPAKRLEVCRALTEGGLPCGVLMAPIVPYLTDSPAQLDATVRAIAGSGARRVTPIVLHLRPGAREWFMSWLAEHHPRLVPRYRELYGRGSYAPRSYQRRVSERVHDLARRYGIGPVEYARSRPLPSPPPEPPVGETVAKPVQLSLL